MVLARDEDAAQFGRDRGPDAQAEETTATRCREEAVMVT